MSFPLYFVTDRLSLTSAFRDKKGKNQNMGGGQGG